MRVPKVLAAGALRKKHLQILFAGNETKDQETAHACLLMDENNDTEVVMCWCSQFSSSFLFFLLSFSPFFFSSPPFFSSFSSTINLPNLTVTLANERNSLFSVFFSSVFGYFFLFSLHFSPLFMLFFSAPVRSLEGLISSLNISLFRKDSNALILGCKSLLICSKKNTKRKLKYFDSDVRFLSSFLKDGMNSFFPSIGPAAPFEMRQ